MAEPTVMPVAKIARKTQRRMATIHPRPSPHHR